MRLSGEVLDSRIGCRPWAVMAFLTPPPVVPIGPIPICCRFFPSTLSLASKVGAKHISNWYTDPGYAPVFARNPTARKDCSEIHVKRLSKIQITNDLRDLPSKIHIHRGKGKSLKRIAIIYHCRSSRPDVGIAPGTSPNSAVAQLTGPLSMYWYPPLGLPEGVFPRLNLATDCKGVPAKSIDFAGWTIRYVQHRQILRQHGLRRRSRQVHD